MSADHGLSERVYAALKADLLAGRDGPGRLQITALARRYACSATPVREAVLRLVGERLIAMSPEGGFSVPRLTVAEARALYEASLQLGTAMTRCEPNRPYGPPSPLRVATIDDVMIALADRSGNRVVLLAARALNDRLARLRQAEDLVVGLGAADLPRLEAALRSDRMETLRRALRVYCRRRIRHVDAIVRETNVVEQDVAQ